jgi:hypothetical protein
VFQVLGELFEPDGMPHRAHVFGDERRVAEAPAGGGRRIVRAGARAVAGDVLGFQVEMIGQLAPDIVVVRRRR